MIKERIKNDILNNELPRGLPLRQAELSSRYGVSRIPIRDALLSLKEEGWLSAHGKAGVMIPDLNWKEAEDLYLMRAELECLLFEMAFDHIDEERISRSNSFLNELDQESLSLIRRGELNWLFHQTLYQAAHRATLEKTVKRLNLQAIRYLGFQYGPLAYKDKSQDEHHQLLMLITENRKDDALVYLREHIEEAGKLLVNYLQHQEMV